MPRPFAVIALSCALLAAGCGGDDEPDPKTQVRETLQAFVASVNGKDAQRLCDLIDPEALEGIAGQGLPCEVAMREQFLPSVQDAQLTVGAITVDGDQATAEVKASAAGQPPATTELPLRRVEGDWKLSFSEEPQGTATPSATATRKPSQTPTPTPGETESPEATGTPTPQPD